MVCARATAARSRRARLRRARLAADPSLAGADGRRRLGSRARDRGRRRRDRRALRDADLVWLARDDQGRALVKQGRVEDGLRIVDEALAVAAAGELSPVVTGIVYCNTIAYCRDAYEIRHAREWTDALTRWCDSQPEMVAHNGLCLVHRAEMMQLHRRVGGRAGAGPARRRALHPGRLESPRLRQGALPAGGGPSPARRARRGGEGLPRGEPLRLRAAAGSCARCGWRRATMTLRPARSGARSARRPSRSSAPRCCPAYVEIMLDAGDVQVARSACRQLDEIAQRQRSDALDAMSAYAHAAVALAEGDVAGRPARGAPRGRGVAGTSGAIRDRARPRARRARLPVAGRRGHGRAGAGGGSRDRSRSWAPSASSRRSVR